MKVTLAPPPPLAKPDGSMMEVLSPPPPLAKPEGSMTAMLSPPPPLARPQPRLGFAVQLQRY